MLRVTLFALAKQLAGRAVIEVPWRDGDTVVLLKEKLLAQVPALQSLARTLLVAVNNDYANDSLPVHITDEVACFPPVSGG